MLRMPKCKVSMCDGLRDQFVNVTQGRYVTIIRLDGKLACIDAICFHAGGPLVSSLRRSHGTCGRVKLPFDASRHTPQQQSPLAATSAPLPKGPR